MTDSFGFSDLENSPTARVEELKRITFNIFPNPSKGILNINSPSLNIFLKMVHNNC